ncbi:MAG: penicillin acylase family protein [Candidatus Eremiobacteraeota bacterium]|nr:penicillin acylase family protein [Candidatus Eremiobacteraeota bacterium]
MSFFERPDPRLMQSADPTPAGAVIAALVRDATALGLCVAVVAAAYAVNVAAGLREAARTRGSIVVVGLSAPATIVRDGRGVPHVSAADDHDLYLAEGYAQGSDRLFQLDLTRRYAYGRLAEVLGARALRLDEAQRAVDIDGIARRQLAALPPRDREALAAFSDGVNAAAANQPVPVEFRMLLYRPARWTPKDSLAVAVVASLELADSWHDVFARDAVWRGDRRCYDSRFPLSDARYDVTVDGVAAAATSAPAPARDCDGFAVVADAPRRAAGSNAWAAGALRSRDGHALIANDPHLDLTIPGIWYLVDIRAPGLHAAGATIPGIPGVVLGHNERVAWASTNADMTTTSVFVSGRLDERGWSSERFHVRFAPDVRAHYYRTRGEFSVADDNDPTRIALVRWPLYAQTRSTISTALALDRAHDVRDALRILGNYRGSPQNFVLADVRGEVAYHVAGLVPDDPAWGRYVHPARDGQRAFPLVPFDRLPHRNPARGTVLVSANNRPYGFGYPYRLSAQFEPPYRAYRIATLLRSRSAYDAAYFARMQLDTLSPIDLRIARDVARFSREHRRDVGADGVVALSRWDGRYTPDSRAATLEHALRTALYGEGRTLGAPRDERDVAAALAFAAREPRRWREAGAIRIEHPLAPMNFSFLNGALLPGAGDEYTIHLQEPGFAQGFRAVWDVGDWDRGGIAIPSGESGEPGSGHYTDLTRDWVGGTLPALPFTRAAIERNAAAVLELLP